MKNISFSDSELSELTLHYLQEYDKTIKRLEDIKSIVAKLGLVGLIPEENGKHIDPILSSKLVDNGAFTPQPEVAKRRYTKRIKAEAKQHSVATPAKKRGPKPKKISWSKFILMTLANNNAPMSAGEILEAGYDRFAVSGETQKTAMATVQATLFRLTKKTNELYITKGGDDKVSSWGLMKWQTKRG